MNVYWKMVTIIISNSNTPMVGQAGKNLTLKSGYQPSSQSISVEISKYGINWKIV